jgi:glycosyltransferase XagB
VTEDADLGTRIASLGYRTRMLDSLTQEEAPNQLPAWIRQRSRWMKGYMQTWLVHMRKPMELYHTLGTRSFLGFQFFIGFSTFTFLTAPVIWLLFPPQIQIGWLPNWLWNLTIITLLINIISHWWMALYCSRKVLKSNTGLIAAALLYPFYLLLHSVASYVALWQLIVKPHFWEKTTHGLALHVETDNV